VVFSSYGLSGPAAFCTSWAMVLANNTTASPPIAAKAASLALSMRRGLPPAVMYRNPAHARNSAAAARPTFVAASSSISNSWIIGCGLLIDSAFGRLASARRTSRCRAVHATATVKMGTPEAAEDRLDGHQLTFGRRVDLQAAPNVNADVGDPVVRIGVCNRWAKNATIGIDRGTADWLRYDARLAARNTYGALSS